MTVGLQHVLPKGELLNIWLIILWLALYFIVRLSSRIVTSLMSTCNLSLMSVIPLMSTCNLSLISVIPLSTCGTLINFHWYYVTPLSICSHLSLISITPLSTCVTLITYVTPLSTCITDISPLRPMGVTYPGWVSQLCLPVSHLALMSHRCVYLCHT